MAQRSSRKRRKARQRAARPADAAAPLTEPGAQAPAAGGQQVARGSARGRARDDSARAALEPLADGERPLAVTIGALVAVALAIGEIVSFGLGYSPGEQGRIVRSVVVVALLSVMAIGMWRTRYWAVLGMQAVLALTIIFASVAAINALNLNAVILVVAILVPAGTLFWFLVKSMARIQMPERRGR